MNMAYSSSVHHPPPNATGRHLQFYCLMAVHLDAPSIGPLVELVFHVAKNKHCEYLRTNVAKA